MVQDPQAMETPGPKDPKDLEASWGDGQLANHPPCKYEGQFLASKVT